MTTRRRFLETVGGGLTGGLLTRGGLASAAGWLARGLPVAAGAAVLGWPRRAEAAVVLDPLNPLANFTQENAKSPPDAGITPGSGLLIVSDTTASDLITLYAPEPDIAAGFELDLVVTFLVTPGETRQGADTGVRFVINDGTRAIYACCIVKGGVKGIGLASGTDFGAEGNYLASSFVAVDWTNPNPPTADGLVTMRLRRTAQGTAQILEVNGVAPQPPVELVRFSQPAPVRPRAGPTVEFGCMNLEAIATAWITVFRIETAVIPVLIKIKPGSDEPSINLASAGVIPVAILSSPTFDATQVDPASVSLAGAKVKLIGKAGRYSCSFEDVNGDGRLDLMCHVETASFFLETGESLAVLEAETFDGRAIRGQETVRIVP
jgi:hypothetical protein